MSSHLTKVSTSVPRRKSEVQDSSVYKRLFSETPRRTGPDLQDLSQSFNRVKTPSLFPTPLSSKEVWLWGCKIGVDCPIGRVSAGLRGRRPHGCTGRVRTGPRCTRPTLPPQTHGVEG